MKYLKYLLGLIVLISLIFFGSGILRPSVTYGTEITVSKSAAEAMAVMSDESKVSQWLKGLTKIEHLSGPKGEVGGVTQYTYVEDGQESVIVETIKSLKQNEHIAMDFVMEGVMSMDYRVDFDESQGRTTIKSKTTSKGEGIFMRSMFSFMKGAMKSQEDENMASLKTLIEENTTNYFPEPVVESI